MSIARDKAIFELDSIEQLYIALTKRKDWKKIRPEILRPIFDNAKGNIDRIKEFILVSEHFNCVRNNFIIIAEDKNTDMALASFGTTMVRLAGSIYQQIEKLADDSEEQKQAFWYAGMAYWSAITCDPFQFAGYNGLAWIYHSLGLKDRAIEMCKLFDEVEKTLLQTSETSLNYHLQAIKEGLPEMRNAFNYVKDELGLPHEPLQELKETGLCPKCNKTVVPTFHGCCPECGEFLIGI